MLRKYILVCHYGSLPKNNLVSPHKSGPLKTQAPPPPQKKQVLGIFLAFLVRIIFLFPVKQQFQKNLPSLESFFWGGGREGEWWRLTGNKEWEKKILFRLV